MKYADKTVIIMEGQNSDIATGKVSRAKLSLYQVNTLYPIQERDDQFNEKEKLQFTKTFSLLQIKQYL